MKRSEIVAALVVTAEVVGHEMSETAAGVIATELAQYEPGAIAAALKRCRRECRGRLTLGDVLTRIPGAHPGTDEAWSIASQALDETKTVVWTEPMAQAWEVARGLLRDGDAIAARMAFRDAYARLVAECGEIIPKWSASLGWDKQGRRTAIDRAVELGRLPPAEAVRLLPPETSDAERYARVLAGSPMSRLVVPAPRKN